MKLKRITNSKIFLFFVLLPYFLNSQTIIKTIGQGGDYTSIQAAINSISTITITSPYLFLIRSDYQSINEIYPINLPRIAGSNSINTITLKPAPGTSPIIVGSIDGNAIITITNGQYYIIDGSNTVGGNTRDLTIQNISTNLIDITQPQSYNSNSVVWFKSTRSDITSENNVLKNCNIIGYSAPSNPYGASNITTGILLYSRNPFIPPVNDTSENFNYSTLQPKNNLILNNSLRNFQLCCIAIIGQGFNKLGSNNKIIGNELGLAGNPFSASYYLGIHATFQKNLLLSKNIINAMSNTTSNVLTANFGKQLRGISLHNIFNSKIEANKIIGFDCRSGDSAFGIYYDQRFAVAASTVNKKSRNSIINNALSDLHYIGTANYPISFSGIGYYDGRNDTVAYNSMSVVATSGNGYNTNGKDAQCFLYRNTLPIGSSESDSLVFCNNILYFESLFAGSKNYVLNVSGNFNPILLNAQNFSSNCFVDTLANSTFNNFAKVNNVNYKFFTDFISTYPNYDNYNGYIGFIDKFINLRLTESAPVKSVRVNNNLNVAIDFDSFIRFPPSTIGAFQSSSYPLLISASPAIIKTGKTLTVRGSNLYQIRLSNFAETITITKDNYLNSLSNTFGDTSYEIKIPDNLANGIYTISGGINNSFLSKNTIPIRIYNFSSDSVYVKNWGLNDWNIYPQPFDTISNPVFIGFLYGARFVLRSDGTYLLSGDKSAIGNTFPISSPIRISGGARFVSIADQNQLYLKGTWGRSLSPITFTHSYKKVSEFACGTTHINFKDSSGNGITVSDLNLNGEKNISGALKVSSVGAGYSTTFFENKGTIYSIGLNNFGQINIPSILITDIYKIVGGHTHTTFLRNNGTVAFSGNYNSGQTNPPSGINNIIQVRNGAYFTNLLTQDEKFYCFGDKNFNINSKDTSFDYNRATIPPSRYDNYRGLADSFPYLEDVVELGEGISYLFNSVIQRLVIYTSVINGQINPNKVFFKWKDNVKITYSPNSGFVLDSIIIDGINISKDSISSFTFTNAISSHTIKVVYRNANLNPEIYFDPSKNKLVLCPNTFDLTKFAAVSLRVNSSFLGNLSQYQWYRNSIDTNIGGTIVASSSLMGQDTVLRFYPPTDIFPDSSFYYVVVTNSYGLTSTSKTTGAVVIRGDFISWIINDNNFLKCVPINNKDSFKIEFLNSFNLPLNFSLWENNLNTYIGAKTLPTKNIPIASEVFYSNSFLQSTPTKRYFYLVFNFQDGCKDTSEIYEVQWYKKLNSDTLNFFPRTICAYSNSTPLQVKSGLDTFNVSFKWYFNTFPQYFNSKLINFRNDSNYTPITDPNKISQDSLWYFAILQDKFYQCSSDTTPLSGKIFINYPKILHQTPQQRSDFCQGSYGIPLFVSLSPYWSSQVNYEWYKYNLIDGSTRLVNTDSFYRPFNANYDSSYYFAIIKTKPTSVCPNLTDTSKISGIYTAYPKPIINSTIRDTSFCNTNKNISLSLTATSPWNIPINFFLYRNPLYSYNNATLLAIPLQSNNKYNFKPLLNSNFYFFVAFNSNNLMCLDTSNIFNISLAPKPSDQNFSVSLNRSNPLKCLLVNQPTNVEIKVFNSNNIGFTISLYQNNDPSTLNGNSINLTQVNNDSFVSEILNFNSALKKYFYVITTNYLGCSDTSNYLVIDWFNNISIFTGNLSGNTYCQNKSPTPLFVTSNGLLNSSNTNFYWYANNSPTYNNSFQLSTPNDSVFYPPTLLSANTFDTTYYFVIAQSIATKCAIDTSIISGPIILSYPSIITPPMIHRAVSCINTQHDTLRVKYNKLNSTTIFSWYRNNVPTFKGSTLFSTDSFCIPSSNLADTAYYFCIIEFNGSSCFGTDTSKASPPIITVAKPVITPFSSPLNLCDNRYSTTLNAQVNFANKSSLIYKWYFDTIATSTNPILLKISNIDTIILAGRILPSNFYLKLIVENSSGCSDSTHFSKVNINPQPYQQGLRSEIQGPDTLSCLNILTATKYYVQIFNPNNVGYQKQIDPRFSPSFLFSSNTRKYNDSFPVQLTQNSSPEDTTIYFQNLSYDPKERVNYYFTILENDYGCRDSSKIKAIEFVLQNSIAGNLSGDTYCQGAKPLPLVVSLVSSPVPQLIQYEWYANTDPIFRASKLISKQSNGRFFPPTAPPNILADTTYYFCIARNPNFSCGPDTSNFSGPIVVIYPFITNKIDTTPSISCVYNKHKPLQIKLNNFWYQQNIFIQWFKTPSKNYNTGQLIESRVNDTTFSYSSSIPDSFYIFSIAHSTTTCPNSADTSNFSGIFYNFPLPLVIKNDLDTQYCLNDSFRYINIFAVNAWNLPITYCWYKNIIPDTIASTLISCGNSDRLLVKTSITDTNYYFASAFSLPSCTDQSNLTRIVIGDVPKNQGIYSILNDSSNTLCQGINDSNFINVKAISPNNIPIFIDLYYKINDTLSSPINLPYTSNSPNLYQSAKFYQNWNKIYYFYTQLTDKFGCHNFTPYFPISWVNFISISPNQFGSYTFCRSNTIPPLIVHSLANDISRVNYQWFGTYDTPNYKSLGFIIENATDSIFQIPNQDTNIIHDSMYYFVVLKDNQNRCQSDTSLPSGLFRIIYPQIDSMFNFTTSRKCQNQLHDSLTITIKSNWNFPLSFQWYRNILPSFSGGTPISTDSIIVPPSNQYDTAYYFVVITGQIPSNPPYCLINPSDTSNLSEFIITYPYPQIVNTLPDTLVCQSNGISNIRVLISYPWADNLRYLWYSNLNQLYNNSNLKQDSTVNYLILSFINFKDSTFYFSQVKNSIGCQDTSNIAKLKTPPKGEIQIDTFLKSPRILAGGTFKVRAIGDGFSAFNWFPQELALPNLSVNFQQVLLKAYLPQTFFVVGTNGFNCQDTANIFIDVVDSLTDIYPSKIITPNNDGINDFWVIKNIELFPENRIFIYNRFNILIRTFSDFSNFTKWFGDDFYGIQLLNGQYFYKIDLYKNGNYLRTKLGDFIIRNQ